MNYGGTCGESSCGGPDIVELLRFAGANKASYDGLVAWGGDDAKLGDEMVQLVQACAGSTNPSITAQCLEQIRMLGNRRGDTMHRVGAMIAAAILRLRDIRWNRAVTLYGPDPDCDATYDCGEEIALTPRNGTAVQSNFTLTTGQMLIGLITGQVDSDAGWQFVAESVKFEDDCVSTMKANVAFNVFEDRAVGTALNKGNPLIDYLYRRCCCNIQFFAEAVHFRITPQQMIQGATLLLLDTKCSPTGCDGSTWKGSLLDVDYNRSVMQFMGQIRGSCRGFSFPGIIGANPAALPDSLIGPG